MTLAVKMRVPKLSRGNTTYCLAVVRCQIQYRGTTFNHFRCLNYVIEYSMPGYRDVEIIERSSGRKIQAVYATDSYQCSRLVEADFGILTVMRNPMHASRHMIGCMGIHGYGSFACYTVLSDRLLLSKLMNIVGKYRIG